MHFGDNESGSGEKKSHSYTRADYLWNEYTAVESAADNDASRTCQREDLSEVTMKKMDGHDEHFNKGEHV